MNHKKVIITIALASVLLLAGCGEPEQGDGSELAEDTGDSVDNVTLGESYWYEVKKTEKNQVNLVRKRPPIQMDDSLERQNLIRRYKYLNDQNNEHYVYLLSNDGKVISDYVAQGKVSSVNSKLTNDKQIVVDQRCIQTTHDDSEGSCFKTVESPQMDGSYGTNGDAIFFFTANGGNYVEWNGKYLVSEEPMQVNTPLSLVSIEEDENGTTSDETGGNSTNSTERITAD